MNFTLRKLHKREDLVENETDSSILPEITRKSAKLFETYKDSLALANQCNVMLHSLQFLHHLPSLDGGYNIYRIGNLSENWSDKPKISILLIGTQHGSNISYSSLSLLQVLNAMCKGSTVILFVLFLVEIFVPNLNLK